MVDLGHGTIQTEGTIGAKTWRLVYYGEDTSVSAAHENISFDDVTAIACDYCSLKDFSVTKSQAKAIEQERRAMYCDDSITCEASRAWLEKFALSKGLTTFQSQSAPTVIEASSVWSEVEVA